MNTVEDIKREVLAVIKNSSSYNITLEELNHDVEQEIDMYTVEYIKRVVLAISKEEFQRLDFELETIEKGSFSEEQIKQRLKVNDTFKKVIALLAIDADKDHLIPMYIKESAIVKNVFAQITAEKNEN